MQRQHIPNAYLISNQLSFNESDKIRAIDCPQEVLDILDKTIGNMWEVQRKQPYGASMEWKLKGCPWDWGHWQNKGSLRLK